MRCAPFGLVALVLLGVPGFVLPQGEGSAAKKKTPGGKDAAVPGAKQAKVEKTVVADAGSANLELPGDLSPEAKRALADAIAAVTIAARATTGREKLLAQAISKLKSAESKAPTCALPYFYLGIAYQLKRSFPEAKAALEKAVKLNPRFHEAYVELGDVCVGQKKLKESLPLYDQALSITPSYADAHDRKALTLARMGSFEAAKAEVDEALKIQKTKGRVELRLLIDRELKGPGWEHIYTVESENYKVLTSVSQEFTKEISDHAELIRRAYNTVFSGVPKPERKFPIWVYDDLDAYRRSGAPPKTAGYYNPLLQRLVVARQSTAQETFLVLHHEAFHQYLDTYLDSPPEWFNEGLGDYFGAYEYVRRGAKESMSSRPNPWRFPGIQLSIQQKILVPATTLMHMSHEEFYNEDTISFNYAEAWGIVYFIIEGNKPEYKPVLINYFNAIHKGRDLNEAYAQTFGRIDMTKFDTEWKTFILGLAIK
jgi:tetratricopeptide (TPR) repeat protein